MFLIHPNPDCYLGLLLLILTSQWHPEMLRNEIKRFNCYLNLSGDEHDRCGKKINCRKKQTPDV